MTYAERSDAQLVELSRRGLAPAFGVLVHRHGPWILERAQGDEDPVGATVAVFVRAMRSLSVAPEDDVRTWLSELATVELGEDTDEGLGGNGTAPARDVTAEPDGRPTTQTIDPRLDEVWGELAVRWPTGKVPRHVPSWLIWVGTVLLLLALAVLLPWALLGSLNAADPAVEELRASPILDVADEDEEDEAEEVPVEEESEPLPTYEFPEPPDEQATAPVTPTDASPPRTDTTADPEPDGSDQPTGEGATDDEGDGNTEDGGTDDAGGDTPADGDADGGTDDPDDSPGDDGTGSGDGADPTDGDTDTDPDAGADADDDDTAQANPADDDLDAGGTA